MKKGLTELVFILDRSGSMEGLENDTIGGYNKILKENKALKSEAHITTVLFDEHYELIHNRVEIKKVKLISEKEYFTRGVTALLDAVGKTIDDIGVALSNTPEENRPEKVLIVIITDGQENSSKNYSIDRIREMIEHQQKVYNWQFLFIGANIDAIATAAGIGIAQDFAVDYLADSKGSKVLYKRMAHLSTSLREHVGDVRSFMNMEKNWKEDIRADYEDRKNKPTKNKKSIAKVAQKTKTEIKTKTKKTK